MPNNSHVTFSGEHSSSVEVLRLQLEANEKLVLAALSAYEEVDEALRAQHRAEQEANELRAREQQWRVTAELRERLIGIIGHDLRNPLNTIVMSGGLLIQRGDLNEKDGLFANRIVTSGQRMARMIDQLTDFTRARLGTGFELRTGPTDLGDICRDVAEELHIGSSAQIRQTSEGDLGGTWDADRLAQALSNITGNAVDHATPGTPVLIHTRDDGRDVVVEITNQGACIPPAVLPVIFKAFRRVDVKATPKTGHLGLGLYIASEIVRVHGGTLDVRSSDGTTTFTLRLPRVSAPAAPSSGRSYEHEGPGTPRKPPSTKQTTP